jgi:uncharacterized protein (DUF1800 family)
VSQQTLLSVAPKLAYASTGLEPYVPSVEQPWDDFRAAHLLRRTLIGPKPQEIAEAVQSTPEEVVDRLIEIPFLSLFPLPPATWVNEDPLARNATDRSKIERARVDETRTWWMEQIVNQEFSIRERMTLFWHNHFATQAKDVQRPQWMFMQNTLLRKHSVGNFKTLVEDITHDPAMIYYLDSNSNKVGAPNENYARELMELFTLGVGNYTEDDIGHAARALTGWTVSGRQAVFKNSRHDKGVKRFLGREGTFNEQDIIDIIFEQDAAAEFICGKLYQEFVYEFPDQTIVSQMAQILRDNNYEIKPLLKILLTSAHFFDDAIIGAKIKTPIELTAGTARTLGLEAGVDKDIRGEYLYKLSDALGQKLLDPPNVAGWPGYRIWVSTTTLPERHEMTDELVDGTPRRFGRLYYSVKKPNSVDFIKRFPDPYDPIKLVKSMGECLTAFKVDAEREELFLATLLEGADTYDWNPDDPNAPRRISNFLKLIFELPEYQLA